MVWQFHLRVQSQSLENHCIFPLPLADSEMGDNKLRNYNIGSLCYLDTHHVVTILIQPFHHQTFVAHNHFNTITHAQWHNRSSFAGAATLEKIVKTKNSAFHLSVNPTLYGIF